MKGVIELNWKIIVSIVAALLIFIIIFLIIVGIISAENLAKGAKELCELTVGKIHENLKGLCDSLYKG